MGDEDEREHKGRNHVGHSHHAHSHNRGADIPLNSIESCSKWIALIMFAMVFIMVLVVKG